MPMLRETENFSIFSIISDDSQNIESQMISSQVENDLRKVIDELPDDQKEVLKMRMYQDLSFKEISNLTGVSINTALGRMRYAVINMRKIIEKNQIILTIS
jgi:RNA polymerase sigma-70 factor (ECF subfamily)